MSHVSLEVSPDGKQTVRLDPAAEYKGDEEAQIIRDAIDMLAEWYVRKGRIQEADILLKWMQHLDVEEGVKSTSLHILEPDEAPLAQMAQMQYYGAMAQTADAPRPVEPRPQGRRR